MIEIVKNRILEIENELKKLPKVNAGNPLQVIKFSLSCEKRRLKLKLSKLMGFHHTLKDEFNLIRKVNGKCAYCGYDKTPSIDHIISVDKGGHNGISNLQVLCLSCNCKKSNK